MGVWRPYVRFERSLELEPGQGRKKVVWQFVPRFSCVETLMRTMAQGVCNRQSGSGSPIAPLPHCLARLLCMEGCDGRLQKVVVATNVHPIDSASRPGPLHSTHAMSVRATVPEDPSARHAAIMRASQVAIAALGLLATFALGMAVATPHSGGHLYVQPLVGVSTRVLPVAAAPHTPFHAALQQQPHSVVSVPRSGDLAPHAFFPTQATAATQPKSGSSALALVMAPIAALAAVLTFRWRQAAGPFHSAQRLPPKAMAADVADADAPGVVRACLARSTFPLLAASTVLGSYSTPVSPYQAPRG